MTMIKESVYIYIYMDTVAATLRKKCICISRQKGVSVPKSFAQALLTYMNRRKWFSMTEAMSFKLLVG